MFWYQNLLFIPFRKMKTSS